MREWGEGGTPPRGCVYFDMVAFVLVGDEFGASEGYIVSERG